MLASETGIGMSDTATAGPPQAASRFEVTMARLWNIANEGKPFTPVFVVAMLALLATRGLEDSLLSPTGAAALAVLLPLFIVFYRFAFPLRLRGALWVYLAVFTAISQFVDLIAIGVVLGTYLFFTVVLWGTIYYRLRIGTPWTNFTRFWRLVLENPDPTSGNFLEQVPKVLLLISAFLYLGDDLSWSRVGVVEGLTLAIVITAALLHQWLFTWVPALPLAPTRLRSGGHRFAERVIVIAIDGCRVDRLAEARTPIIDRLRAEGTSFTNMHTVYPARTVTGFSSMLTGAPPAVHGMRSNFVPRLGVQCDSVFEAFARNGRTARLVGIAHLIDAFGDGVVRSVTARMNNDAIDDALVRRAQNVLRDEDPDLLILQLLSVDQTGHARGSYNTEYLQKIEATDTIIGNFLDWLREAGYLHKTTVIVTSDHGQGIGIGGHGHMTPSEIHIPCVLWGEGVQPGLVREEATWITDIAATVSYLMGVEPPRESTGQVLVDPDQEHASEDPLAVIIPAYNEVKSIGSVIGAIPRAELPRMRVIVVDDGSSDGTVAAAKAAGADVIVQHETNRGLGAALRTGIETARTLGSRGAVYLDADGEYDPAEIPDLLTPIEQGTADYVLGSRYRGQREGQRYWRLLGNLVFTSILCGIAGRRITDGQTGFRAFSRSALESAEILHDYNYAQVLTLDLLQKGFRLAEVPISYRPRKTGRSFIGVSYLWRVPVGMAREVLRS